MNRPLPRKPYFWTPPRLFRLAELTERGWDDRRIAAALSKEWGRPMTAAAISSVRWRHRQEGPMASALSAREVARMMGLLDEETVIRWCHNGWLRAGRGMEMGMGYSWRIAWLDLWTFVEDPRFWCLWEQELVTDERLRRHIRAVRGQPVWVPTRDAVAVLAARGVRASRSAVWFWLRSGHLPFITLPVPPGANAHSIARRSLRLIPAAALATFQPPLRGQAAIEAKRRRASTGGGT